MDGWVEGLALGLDLDHSVVAECRQQLALNELDPLQEALQVPALTPSRVIDGALQVIDRRKQILDEILVAVLGGLLALLEGAPAEVLELGLKPQVLILVGGQTSHGIGRLGLIFRQDAGVGLLGTGVAFAGGLGRGFDGLGGLAQRLLEFRVGRERSLPVVRSGPVALIPLLGRHAWSFSLTTWEKKLTSGITRS